MLRSYVYHNILIFILFVVVVLIVIVVEIYATTFFILLIVACHGRRVYFVFIIFCDRSARGRIAGCNVVLVYFRRRVKVVFFI